jgi:hypothetical protein
MASVRIAQIGQISVNRPVFEVMVDSNRYAMAADGNGRVGFINRKSLRNFGLYSSLANMFKDAPEYDFQRALQLTSSENDCILDGRFVVRGLSSGPSLVADYSYANGWQNAAPQVAQVFEA